MDNEVIREEASSAFNGLMKFVGRKSEKAIEKTMMDHFKRLPIETRTWIEDYFAKYKFWGTLNIKKGDYEVFRIRAQILREQRGYFIELHKRLADSQSKNVLYAILANWLYWDTKLMDVYKERFHPEYFDPAIFERRKDEVFVDLGAFNGDSALSFIKTYEEYKRIYCYEITPDIFQSMKNNLQKYPNIELRQKGAGAAPGQMYLSQDEFQVANRLVEEGSMSVDVVRIDDDINEPVTFIKMDIESGEQNAIRGCTRQIQENRPNLAICTYHGNHDLYAIPQLIDDIQPGYKFYMRYHGNNVLIPHDFTLLAAWPDGK